MDDILEQVRDFADRAHGNQRRKYSPDRYIVHPVRVMACCRQYTNHLPLLAAALLHDVLEDTPVTVADLRAYLTPVLTAVAAAETLELVVELTDVYTHAAYPHWNRRKRKEKERDRMARISPDAQTIKYADILDNCAEIVPADPQFAPRFLNECRLLLQAMPKGHSQLYQKTRDAVYGVLGQLRRR